jgi:hypothetical protein
MHGDDPTNNWRTMTATAAVRTFAEVTRFCNAPDVHGNHAHRLTVVSRWGFC